jgi:hypothetical protein
MIRGRRQVWNFNECHGRGRGRAPPPCDSGSVGLPLACNRTGPESQLDRTCNCAGARPSHERRARARRRARCLGPLPRHVRVRQPWLRIAAQHRRRRRRCARASFRKLLHCRSARARLGPSSSPRVCARHVACGRRGPGTTVRLAAGLARPSEAAVRRQDAARDLRRPSEQVRSDA